MSADRQPPAFPSVGGRNTSPDGETSIFSPAAAAPSVGNEPLERAPAELVVRGGHGDRYRWGVAAVATLAVVVIVGALLLFAGSRSGTPSTVAHFAPADVTAYFEARLDLPGDQRDQLASFMSHFPGFADQASFELKLDETLNSMIRSTETGLDWARDIEPWFGGEVAIFGTEPVDPAMMTAPANMTIVLTVTDRAALESLIAQKLGDTSTSDEDFNGVTIRTIDQDEGPEMSFAVTDEAMVAGTGSDRVKAALDVRADRATGLADDEFFLRQLGSLHADRLATMYFAHEPSATDLPELPVGLPIDLPMGCAAELTSAGAIRAVAEVRAEGQAMTLSVRARPAPTEGLPLPPNEPSVLAASMPADSVAYFEMRQLGASISHRLGRLIDCIGGTEGGAALGQLEQFLGTAPESYLDFVDDAAVAVAFADGKPTGGLIATVDDETVARTRLERLLTTVRALAGLGGGISVSEEEHGAATLTVITFDGASAPMVPAETSLAITVANGRMYIGLRDFVVQALDRLPADSLSSNLKFSAALSAGGSTSAGLAYVDLGRARTIIEAGVDPALTTDYATDAQPFLAPFSHLSFVARTDGDVIVSNIFLYVE